MDQKITKMKGLVVRAGKYVALGIIFVACLPVISPLLLLFSFFGIVFFLPLVSALAGIFYFRKYAALLYRTLLRLGPAHSRGGSRGRHFTGPEDHPVDTTLSPLSIKDVQAHEYSAEEDEELVPVSSAVHDGEQSETGSSSGNFQDDGTVAEDKSGRQHIVLERMHVKEDGETLQTSAPTEGFEKGSAFSIDRQDRAFETFQEFSEENPHVKHTEDSEEDKLEGADRSNVDSFEAALHSLAEQERKHVSAAPNVSESQEGTAEQQRQDVSPAADDNEKGQDYIEDERELLPVEAPNVNEECEEYAEDKHDFLSEELPNMYENGEDYIEDKHDSLAEGAPNDNKESEDFTEGKHEFLSEGASNVTEEDEDTKAEKHDILSEGAPNVTEEGEDVTEDKHDILSEGASNVNDEGENRTEEKHESPLEGVYRSDIGRFEADSKCTMAEEGIAEQEGQVVSQAPNNNEEGEDSTERFHGEVVTDRQRSDIYGIGTDREVGEELGAQPEVNDEESNASKKSATSISGRASCKRDEETKREVDPITNLLPHQAHADDLWICKECGWKYPNAKPSAKIRRNHKKHCKGTASPVQSPGADLSVLKSPECDADREWRDRVGRIEGSMPPFSPSSPGFSPQQKLEKNSSMTDESSPEASFHREREWSAEILIADKAVGEDSPKEKDSEPSVPELKLSSSQLQSEAQQAESGSGEIVSSVKGEENDHRLPAESSKDEETHEEERKIEEVGSSLRTQESDLDLRAESSHDEANEHSLVLESPKDEEIDHNLLVESPKDEEIDNILTAEIPQDEKKDDHSFQVEASKEHQHDRNLPADSLQDEEKHDNLKVDSNKAGESDRSSSPDFPQDEENDHKLPAESPKEEETDNALSAEFAQNEKKDNHSFEVEASKVHQHDRNLPADFLQNEGKHQNLKVDSTRAEESDRNSSPEFPQDEETDHKLPAAFSEEEAFNRNLPAQSSKEEKNDHSVVTESLQDKAVDHNLGTKSSTDEEIDQSMLPEALQHETIDHDLVKKSLTGEGDDRHLPAESPQGQGEATLQAQTPASSKAVALDKPPLSPASSGVYEDPMASESFRSASESFRLAPDEFFDDEASSIGDSQDGRSQVQEELQLQQELNTIKGIVGDQNISGATLVMEIEELSEFLGFDLPDRRENVPELEWARLCIEVMKVVVGLE